jgi:hypothetical protein
MVGEIEIYAAIRNLEGSRFSCDRHFILYNTLYRYNHHLSSSCFYIWAVDASLTQIRYNEVVSEYTRDALK